MEVKGLCAICGLPVKLYTCQLCGKTVCSQCIDLKKGICISCSSGRAGHYIHDLGDNGGLK
ncbi:hypothetical protein RG963_05540 [Methanosarcina sp. Z-7115]|uniref:Orotate phosphoribosyltransferase n=1 Tax=Methanosarcina baikalica TaxID=3073890 RepID=A0ABU2CZT9_9EURY|nr:hypothetical protein [Methanosarcina sp. Z-7115]MDR7665254.1 hypothetical protein [Methanosarcina sp. Z-7115]